MRHLLKIENMAMYMYILNVFLFGTSYCFLLEKGTHFQNGQVQGHINSGAIDEASGLAASRTHSDILYTHNDKGGQPIIYAINAQNGHLVAEFTVTGVVNYDWEDIAVGHCQDGAGYCIFIGETGDHGGTGSKKIIYRIREPAQVQNQNVAVDAQLHFTWGEFDAETLMIAPSGNMYIVSKIDYDDGVVPKVGEIPASAWGQDIPVKITNIIDLTTIHSTHKDPVGGDISPDGTEILIKAKDNVFYWQVPSGGDYLQVLQTPPRELPYTHEKQGEAACWDARGSGYYTLSEGHHQPLYYYSRH